MKIRVEVEVEPTELREFLGLPDVSSLQQDALDTAIIQDASTSTVLMLGFMNAEALEKTRKEGKVTFFSRTKNRLWTKGEESGNFLHVVEIARVMSTPPIVIDVDASIEEAARVMAQHKIGCLPVMENERLLGLVTETDVLFAVLKGPVPSSSS